MTDYYFTSHEVISIVVFNQKAAQTGNAKEPVGRSKTCVQCVCF